MSSFDRCNVELDITVNLSIRELYRMNDADKICNEWNTLQSLIAILEMNLILLYLLMSPYLAAYEKQIIKDQSKLKKQM